MAMQAESGYEERPRAFSDALERRVQRRRAHAREVEARSHDDEPRCARPEHAAAGGGPPALPAAALARPGQAQLVLAARGADAAAKARGAWLLHESKPAAGGGNASACMFPVTAVLLAVRCLVSGERTARSCAATLQLRRTRRKGSTAHRSPPTCCGHRFATNQALCFREQAGPRQRQAIAARLQMIRSAVSSARSSASILRKILYCVSACRKPRKAGLSQQQRAGQIAPGAA